MRFPTDDFEKKYRLTFRMNCSKNMFSCYFVNVAFCRILLEDFFPRALSLSAQPGRFLAILQCISIALFHIAFIYRCQTDRMQMLTNHTDQSRCKSRVFIIYYPISFDFMDQTEFPRTAGFGSQLAASQGG